VPSYSVTVARAYTARGFKHGGEPLSRAQYHRLLSNPIYYGVIDFAGERYEGAHDPIIANKLFDAFQDVSTRKSKPKTSSLELRTGR
jgi:recombinase